MSAGIRSRREIELNRATKSGIEWNLNILFNNCTSTKVSTLLVALNMYITLTFTIVPRACLNANPCLLEDSTANKL